MVYVTFDLRGYILYIFLGFHTANSCSIQTKDWVERDDKFYYFSKNRLTRNEASDFCHSCDAILVIDNDNDTHNYLKNSTTGDHWNEGYWIGINLSDFYHWIDGSGQRHLNMDRITGDKNNSCVVSYQGDWQYRDCNEEHHMVCKKVGDMTSCEAWELFDGNCYGKELWQDDYITAVIRCQDLGGHLTSILSTIENNFLVNNITSEEFWIGMTRYIWPNNKSVEFQAWRYNHNMGAECVAMKKYIWFDEKCTATLPFICEREQDEQQTNRPSTTQDEQQTNRPSTTLIPLTSTQNKSEHIHESNSPTESIETDISTSIYAQTTDFVILVTTPSESFRTEPDYKMTAPFVSTPISTQLVQVTEKSVLPIKRKVGPELIGGVVGAVVVLILIVVISVLCYRRSKRKSHKAKKGDYDASYEIAFSPNTEDKTRNSDSSLTDDEKLAQLRNRDSRVVIDANVPDSEKIKPYLVTTIVDGHREGQPSRRSKVVSSIEDRVEYDNNNLDELIVTDNDLYHSSGSDPNTSDGRPRSTDYDYAVRPPHPNQQSQANVFINNAYDGEAEGGAGNHNQGAQIQYADIAFSTETLNKENTYADIDDFAPHLGESDANVPTTAGVAPSENKPSNANNETDSDNQVGKMKAIPVYAEVDANKMDKNKNEIIDDRKDAHDLEEGVNDLIVTDNDLYDFNN